MDKIVDMPRKTSTQKAVYWCRRAFEILTRKKPEPQRQPMATRKPQPVVPIKPRIVAFAHDRVIVDDPNNEPPKPRAA